MTTSSTSLDALAARCGILASFTDARGKDRQTRPQTQAALLAAMGIECEGEDGVRAALDALHREEWSHALPPVCVIDLSRGPGVVALTLPTDTQEASWRLMLENGELRSGTEKFDGLELIERGSVDGKPHERRHWRLPDDVPTGYHELVLEGVQQRMPLIVSSGKCWLPEATLAGGREWGLSLQLYLLRSQNNWGIGDFGDLAALAAMSVPLGVQLIGLNPLHAMFVDDPERASPYSPASRLILNPLYIDVGEVLQRQPCDEARGWIEAAQFKGQIAKCHDADLVDYRGVAELKLTALRRIFEEWDARQDSAAWKEFERFRADGGELLLTSCLFQALREYFTNDVPRRPDWHAWPEEYRDPHAPAARQFATDHARAVTFYAWLQFIADGQLAAAARAAKPMTVGLYRDLAVGADPSGAETWGSQQAVIEAAQVGAPPDIHNPAGQDWGLPPFSPRALRAEGYRSFIQLLRANMRHAGGLRIDHVMALRQLYWIPRGAAPEDGAYVRYPLEDLVAIIALESERNRCLVVGEDLGTVPDGFREQMAAANVLSYRVLYFEKDEAGFLPPERYPSLAVAVAGNHDLATLRGWWEDNDLALKDKLKLYPSPTLARLAREERKTDRSQLVTALEAAGLVDSADVLNTTLVRAAHAFLARSPAAFVMAQIDDITDEVEQVNVPATSDQHPNWRRKLSIPLEALADAPRLTMLAQEFRRERGNPP